MELMAQSLYFKSSWKFSSEVDIVSRFKPKLIREQEWISDNQAGHLNLRTDVATPFGASFLYFCIVHGDHDDQL